MTKKNGSKYKPTENEKFMGAKQKAYFRKKLLDWKNQLLVDARDTLSNLQESSLQEPDVADRASKESDHALELRTRDRQRKLLNKIEEALERIDAGTFGYCEESGEPISLKRLEARPIATLSLESQERHEKMEKVYRDN